MGDIGTPQRHIEFEPVPDAVPEPNRAPVEPSRPTREPVPA